MYIFIYFLYTHIYYVNHWSRALLFICKNPRGICDIEPRVKKKQEYENKIQNSQWKNIHSDFFFFYFIFFPQYVVLIKKKNERIYWNDPGSLRIPWYSLWNLKIPKKFKTYVVLTRVISFFLSFGKTKLRKRHVVESILFHFF